MTKAFAGLCCLGLREHMPFTAHAEQIAVHDRPYFARQTIIFLPIIVILYICSKDGN